MAFQRNILNGVERELWTNATHAGDPTPSGYTARDASGVVTTQRALTAAETTWLAGIDTRNTQATNQATLQQQGITALTNNQNYLGIASPTNAQVVAQVQALTKQMDGVIRLLLNQLNATT
jgi:hypothetical protein